jgi:hypothetical protein
MVQEPTNIVIELLREMRLDIAQFKSEMRTDIADVKSEMHSLRADVASDIATVQAEIRQTRKELSEQIVGLRRAVMEYHSSAIGHGALISEMEERLRRVHLKLPPKDAH